MLGARCCVIAIGVLGAARVVCWAGMAWGLLALCYLSIFTARTTDHKPTRIVRLLSDRNHQPRLPQVARINADRAVFAG